MSSLRRLPRSFSLRTAFVLVALVCLVLAVGVRRAKRVLAQKRAVQAVLASEDEVYTTDGDLRPFFAPDWQWAVGLVRVPHVTFVYLVGLSELDDQHPALPLLAAIPTLEWLQIDGGWFDDRCAEHVKSLNTLVGLDLSANKGLTANGFALLLRPKLEHLSVTGADLRDLTDRKLAWPAALELVALHDCQGMDRGACIKLSRALGESCDLLCQTHREVLIYRGGRIVERQSAEPPRTNSDAARADEWPEDIKSDEEDNVGDEDAGRPFHAPHVLIRPRCDAHKDQADG